MNFFHTWDIDMEYVILGLLAFSFILLIIVMINMIQIGKLKKKYKSFMDGDNGKSLESKFIKKFEEVDNLKHETKNIFKRLNEITENLAITYQKMSIVKYDAFKEMGGKLSFAIALLNDNNDGFIVNSMHSSREGCYTYIKEIIKGESYVVLAEEEKVALEEAKKSKQYI